ncbi:hypothetical protein M0657_007575 [Pyricularia oryzae]|uniref:F-box domain-containing protein n=1 Tax=Pyricularia oryzae (strain Y34) TaxID=1143189 RepID=A0AA97NUL3_PYRO3|nr:hypothetical protein OOU_Y34scaffold00645g6 [Pyricularia oryzae Y34]KAI7911273.1 hypothetical protein M9X92_010607 [Pyricularia oryzae]KAI7918454.1 hypothetical protein M0657_007575 [Pyricularia oryzae]
MAATVHPAQKAHTIPSDSLNVCRRTPFSLHSDHSDRLLSKLLSRQTSPPPATRPSKRAKTTHDSQVMAAAARRSRQRRTCTRLPNLASEILVLIFEHVRESSIRDIISVRLVCRWFDKVATPVEYQTLVLTKRLLYFRNPERIYDAYANISLHTNHVFASIDEIESCHDNHRAVARITTSIQNLLTFTWRYARTRSSSACTCPIAQLFLTTPGSHGRLRRGTRVFFENVASRHLENHHNLYLEAIPTELLVSLKMAIPSPPLMTGINGLKQVLLNSRSLESFHYQDKGQGTRFTFSAGERLPPLKKLRLECYDWCHSREEVLRHWDFSRIQSLELLDMPVFKALRAIEAFNLYGLHTLVTRDSGISDTREELSAHLAWIIRQRTRSLKKLELTVDMRHFDPASLLVHAATLEILSLRDFIGFGDESRRCPTMWLDHLSMLARELKNLHTLELDMDTLMTNPPAFIETLARFPSLHTLTLHVQTVVHPWDEVISGVDRDAEAAMHIFTALLRHKSAAAVAMYSHTSQNVWRQVTLNIGGWKPVMVRRLSPAWKSKNEHGVFAERCFVMQQHSGASLADPYFVTEVATEELGREQREQHRQREPVRAYLRGTGLEDQAIPGPGLGHQPISENTHHFTEVVLEYISGGARPPGPIFAHQTKG